MGQNKSNSDPLHIGFLNNMQSIERINTTFHEVWQKHT